MPQQYRYGSTIKNYRKITNTVATDATSVSRSGPQLLRHSQKAHPWIGQNINQVIDADVPYTGTGQDIDIIVVDNGVRIAHPEFVNSIVARAKNPSGYVGGNVLGGYCDVLDVVLDFPYWIDPAWFNADPGNRLETRWDGTTVPKDLAARQWWSSETFRSPGVAPPGGITIPVNYTRLNSCGNETQKPLDGSHGTPVASCVYGRTQGWAFNANKWVIWLDAFTDNYDRVFLIQQVFHQFKPTNVAKGNRNPTISVNSWEFLNALDGNGGYLHYRGTRYPFDAPDQRYNWIPYMNGIRFYAGAAHSAEMKTNSVTTRATDCVNAGVIFVAAAGNTNQQLVDSSHPNYDNYWSLTGEGGFEGNTNTFAGVVPGGVEYYNSLNRRGFPAQAGSFIQSGQRTYPVILVGSIGTYVPTGTTTYAREYKDDTSSYGDAVDCFATGEDVLAANHVNGTGILRWDNELLTNATTYEDRNISGTSFAAPTAAGLIACKIETNRTWNYSNIKSWLLNSCGRATNSQIYGVESFASAEDLKWEDRYRINSTLPPVIIWNADNTASLNPSPIYSWDTIPNPINEGASATFVVNTVNVANGTTLYWIITSNAGDFTVSSGSFTINNSTGSFSVSPTADQITEGEEIFTLRVRSESINGTTVLTVFNILINDTSTTPAQTYSFSSTPASINEGTAGTFNVSTANVNDGTTLYWTIDSNAGDFTITSGNFTINSGAGNFSITPTADILTEGQETFTVNVRTGSITGPVVLTASSVIINDTSTTPIPTYTITPTSLTIAEGSSLLFNVTTTNVANGTTLWWFINNTTTTNSDFTSVSGSFTIGSNGTGSFSIGIFNDFVTESTETFTVSLKATNNIAAPSLQTSSIITINDPTLPTYRITQQNPGTQVNEGTSVAFTVDTLNVADTTLYWFVDFTFTQLILPADASDFVATSGSVSIVSGTGTFSVQIASDQLTEQPEVFVVTLRATNDINAPRLTTFQSVSIVGQSQGPSGPQGPVVPPIITDPPTYNINPASLSVDEGSSLNFNVLTTNVGNGTTLYWTIATNAGDFTVTSGNFTINNGAGSFTVTPTLDLLTEGQETFTVDVRTDSITGPVVLSSPSIVINNIPVPIYSFSSVPVSVNEGAVATFNVSTSNVANGTTLYWTIATNVAEFAVASGSFVINNNAGSFSVIPTADLLTEGQETFTVRIRTESITGTIRATSTGVQINDTSTTPPPGANATYAITGTVDKLNNEGDVITYNIGTFDVSNNTIVYWKNIGTTDVRDFANNRNSGQVTIINGSATFSIEILKDFRVDTNYEETIIIQLRTGSSNGPVVATALTEYVFDTSQKLDLIPVSLPEVPLIQIPPGNFPLHVTTVTNSLGLPLWQQNQNLGVLEVGEISEYYIKSNTTQSFGLVYEIISGQLPTGLQLQRDGTISGRAAPGIAVSTDYTFTASYSKSVGSPISTGTFTITVLLTTTTNYTPIWFEPTYNQDQRKEIAEFLSDKNIFSDDSLYRPFDPNFGVSKSLKWYLFYGLENYANLGTITENNFYKRRFSLSEPKIAVAKDELENLIYEVIYSDILDYNINSEGESVSLYVDGFGYPSSIYNMQQRFALGQNLIPERTTVEIFNPRFMKTRQANQSTPLGYIPCVVYCYTLPNKAKFVLDKIKKSKIKFNQIDFVIDRLYKYNQNSNEIDVIRFGYRPNII